MTRTAVGGSKLVAHKQVATDGVVFWRIEDERGRVLCITRGTAADARNRIRQLERTPHSERETVETPAVTDQDLAMAKLRELGVAMMDEEQAPC